MAAMFSIQAMAQQTMYVAKGGTMISVSDIDEVTFEDVAPGDALIVHTSGDTYADTILLSDIQQISFSKKYIFVEMQSNSKDYTVSKVAKLMFKNIGTTAIHNPVLQNIDVIAWVSPEGEAIAKSPVGIKSLRLFSADGKMISQQSYKNAEKQGAVSLQNNAAGIYLLQIETEQGIVVKKVMNPLSK